MGVLTIALILSPSIDYVILRVASTTTEMGRWDDAWRRQPTPRKRTFFLASPETELVVSGSVQT